MEFKGRSIISIADFSKDELLYLLEKIKRIEEHPNKSTLLSDKLMGRLFFEPSTRTRLSFDSAMKQLGGKCIGFSQAKSTSVAKGESLYDTTKMVSQYCDVLVVRHPAEGSARYIAENATIPVINAGDGANQHPTQTLLDLYTIMKTQGKLEGLDIAMVGDLKYGRTVHSLAVALSHFGCRLYFVAPESMQMPKVYKKFLKEKGILFSEHQKIEDVMSYVDVLYMTRIQKERFPDEEEYEKVKNVYCLTQDHLKNQKPNLKILHPLPRVNEIDQSVDTTSHAYYFEQAGNGIPTRQALLCLLLGVKIE